MSQFRGNTGTLIVIVKRARDLPNIRKMEKQSPYCLLRIMNLTDKTKTDVRGGQTPVWDDELRFRITPELQPIVKLSLLDETKKTSVLIAETEVDFTPAFYSSVEEGYDKWHPLTYAGREAGEIYLEMTFYPAPSGSASSSASGSNSFYRKVMPISNHSQTGKRNLPPIPGQQEDIEENILEDAHGIPPPIPRAGESAAALHSFGRSGEFYHSDSYRPSYVQNNEDIFNRSTMSLHSLPDVPSHNNIMKELPLVRKHHQQPEERSPSHQHIDPLSEYEQSHPSIAEDRSSDRIFRSSLDPGRNEKTTDLKAFAKNLTAKYNIPLFGGGGSNRDTSDSSKRSSNAFDELERQVQSDWEQNNPKNHYQNLHKRTPSPQKKAPPPVPSHGSSFSSSRNSLATLPLQNDTPQSSYGNYEVIQPDVGSQLNHQRRKSPTRKAVTDHQDSPERHSQSPERKSPRKTDHGPSPYDLFTQHPSLQDSQTSVRSSPSRFKSSLPPLPK